MTKEFTRRGEFKENIFKGQPSQFVAVQAVCVWECTVVELVDNNGFSVAIIEYVTKIFASKGLGVIGVRPVTKIAMGEGLVLV